VSSNDPILESNYYSPSPNFSPFVLMVERAGLPALAHVIYAAALIAALSVANIDLCIHICLIYSVPG
jgi:amino acid permease